jgi:putative transcriptional regulator
VANHPNRSRKGGPGTNPRPEQIRAAREAAGLTQTEAAALIYCTLRGWQDWEGGQRPMHPAFWEYWQIQAGNPQALERARG